MLPTALREKIRTMGVSDAIEMLVREMGMPHQTAMQEMVRLLEQEVAPVCVLEEGLGVHRARRGRVHLPPRVNLDA